MHIVNNYIKLFHLCQCDYLCNFVKFAKLVGVSNGMISIWENNINEPKASYLKALAVALDTTVDVLLGNDD